MKKYTKKWPHCHNLGGCFSRSTALETAERMCNAQQLCTGFSFETGVTRGWGCLKKCGANEFGGYGANSHDYWMKPKFSDWDYEIKYERKWPHCRNVDNQGGLFQATVTEASEWCELNNKKCSGFCRQTTFRTKIEVRSTTYYKSCFVNSRRVEFNGYGTGAWDYWAKNENQEDREAKRGYMIATDMIEQGADMYKVKASNHFMEVIEELTFRIM